MVIKEYKDSKNLIYIDNKTVIENPNIIDVKNGAFELIYTGILSIGLGFTLQTIAQKHLPPTNVAILLSVSYTHLTLPTNREV